MTYYNNYISDRMNLWIKNSIYRESLNNINGYDKLENELSKVDYNKMILDNLSMKYEDEDKEIVYSTVVLQANGGQQTIQPEDLVRIYNNPEERLWESIQSARIDRNYRMHIGQNKNGLIFQFRPPDEEDDYPNKGFRDVMYNEICPELYLEVCSRPMDWLYTYLMGFENKSMDEINRIATADIDVYDKVCRIENENDRCACHPCYKGHSNQAKHIGKLLKESNVLSSDPWCIYPKCASGTALKNRGNFKRSVCHPISVSGLFLNPSENSNINISNTNISSSVSGNGGINLYGDGNCPDGEHFEVDEDNKRVICVKNSSNSLSNSFRLTNSSNSKHTNITLLIIIAIFSSFLFKKYIIAKFVFISSLVTIIYLIYKNKKSETFNPENDTCGPTQVCPIGYLYFNNECVKGRPLAKGLDIIDSLCHLPRHIHTGIYYYTTVINNEIYAFSQSCVFKYKNNKWENIIDTPGREPRTGTSGWTSFRRPGNPRASGFDENDELLLRLNTYMTCTDGQKIYIYSPKTSSEIINCMNLTVPDNDLIVYDTLENKWELSNTQDTNNNNSVSDSYQMVYLEGKLYIFGNKDFIIVYDTDNISTYQTIELNGNYLMTKTSKAFVYDGEIYISGIYSTTDSNIGTDGYNIVKYNITNNRFEFLEKLGKNQEYFNGNRNYIYNTQLSLTGVLNNLLYNIIEDKMYYYNLSNGNKGVMNVIEPENTVLFEYNTAVSNRYNFEFATCTFEMNGFIFIVMGSGEIFRGLIDDDLSTLTLNPCYGVSNYYTPLKYKIPQL
mgnify:CR=1 FL=1